MHPPGAVVADPPADRPAQLTRARSSLTSKRKSRFSTVLDRDLYLQDDSDEEEQPEVCELQAARDKPLHVQVDVLECTLGIAFRDHRYRVEEILQSHLEAIQYHEAKHDQQLAKLRAENEQLRTRCGVQGPFDLAQTVMLNDAAEKQAEREAAAERAKRGKKGTAAERSPGSKERQRKMVHLDSEDEDSGFPLRLRNGRGGKDKPGGCWQQFVAWVPNGAGLEAPHPWEPLPEHILSPSTLPPGVPASRSPKQDRNGLPGEVVEVEEADDLLSLQHAPDKKRFKVLEMWIQNEEDNAATPRGTHLSGTSSQNLGRDKKFSLNRKLTNLLANRGTARTSVNPTGESQELDNDQKGDWWVLHPHSKARLFWDICGLVLVVFDMIIIPLSLFPLPQSTFLDVMEWTTRLFWTFDMGMSACTGIVMPDGSIQFEFRYVLKRYVKTWLAMDTLIVASDWLELIISSGAGVGTLSRLSRAFRAVRAVRLLRLVRMKEVMSHITERVQSDALAFVLNIAKLVVFIVSVAHVTACIWWGIGASGGEDGATWVSKYSYDTAALEAKYMVSLHWSLSQFTGGMDEITPASAGERFYAVVMWVFAFMAAAIVVSILTSNLTQLHIIGGTRSRQMAMLRKYLVQNHIPSNLALRMQRSAQHALSADLTPDVVELLPVVSEPLRAEMHFELYSGVFKHHPFFHDVIHDSPQVMKRICHYATSTMMMSNGDVIFSKGEVPAEPKMYFVFRGTLDYAEKSGSVGVQLTDRQWVAEMVLWIRWSHRGNLMATGDVKLAMLNAKVFQEVVDRFKDVAHFNAKRYAKEFVDYLNQQEHVNDLTQLPIARRVGDRAPATVPQSFSTPVVPRLS